MNARRRVAAYLSRAAGWFAGYDDRIRERAHAAGYQAGATVADQAVSRCGCCGRPADAHEFPKSVTAVWPGYRNSDSRSSAHAQSDELAPAVAGQGGGVSNAS